RTPGLPPLRAGTTTGPRGVRLSFVPGQTWFASWGVCLFFVSRRSIRIAPPLFGSPVEFPADASPRAGETPARCRLVPALCSTSRHDRRFSAPWFGGSLPTSGPCETLARLCLRPRRSGVASLFWEASGEHFVRSAPDARRLGRLPPASQELVRETESTPKSGESCRGLRGKRQAALR